LEVSTPGPGSYRLPSDFGYYESARAHRPASMNKTSSSVNVNNSAVPTKTEGV